LIFSKNLIVIVDDLLTPVFLLVDVVDETLLDYKNIFIFLHFKLSTTLSRK